MYFSCHCCTRHINLIQPANLVKRFTATMVRNDAIRSFKCHFVQNILNSNKKILTSNKIVTPITHFFVFWIKYLSPRQIYFIQPANLVKRFKATTVSNDAICAYKCHFVQNVRNSNKKSLTSYKIIIPITPFLSFGSSTCLQGQIVKKEENITA